MRINRCWKALLLTLFCAQNVHGGEPLWLSDKPPEDATSNRTQRSHGGPVERGPKGVYRKRLWLRSGGSPAEAAYVTTDGESSSQLLVPDQSMGKLKQPVEKGHAQLLFDMPDEGFYNAYLTQQRVVNGSLEITTAKAEILKHSCREGHDHVSDLMSPNRLSAIPLEIVRERQPEENFHSRVGFGDNISFLVLSRGEPVAGAEVTLHTRSGWRNTAVSDEQGRVAFTVIRDYFPRWELFNSRYRQEYLAVARLQGDESGSYRGETYRGASYVATLPGHYYPSSSDYASYGYGLSFGLFGLTFSGLSVYLYRRRRVRPYREVQCDD
ncbi:MAG: hypothetical protein P8166_02835 [Candidatus Thiodiazotropha sp.]